MSNQIISLFFLLLKYSYNSTIHQKKAYLTFASPSFLLLPSLFFLLSTTSDKNQEYVFYNHWLLSGKENVAFPQTTDVSSKTIHQSKRVR